jgi:hypothetical protein
MPPPSALRMYLLGSSVVPRFVNIVLLEFMGSGLGLSINRWCTSCWSIPCRSCGSCSADVEGFLHSFLRECLHVSACPLIGWWTASCICTWHDFWVCTVLLIVQVVNTSGLFGIINSTLTAQVGHWLYHKQYIYLWSVSVHTVMKLSRCLSSIKICFWGNIFLNKKTLAREVLFFHRRVQWRSQVINAV